MRRLAALAMFLVSLSAAGSASAQPGNTPPPPPAPAPAAIGHRDIVLGAALSMDQEYGGHPEAQGGGGAGEAFAGWAFGRWALMAWGRARIAGDATGVIDLGVAGRIWLPELPRLYAELRAAHEKIQLGHWEDEFAGSEYREGAVVGGGLGLELASAPRFTIDARVMIERGITADTPDYSLVGFALAAHIY